MAQDTTQDLKHADLVKRLLMYHQSGGDSWDIPLGSVRAYVQGSPNPAPRSVGLTGLSLDHIIMNRTPLH